MATKWLCGVRGAWISVEKGEAETEKLGNFPEPTVCELFPSPVGVCSKSSCWAFCTAAGAALASSDPRALGLTRSSWEENRANGVPVLRVYLVCAWRKYTLLPSGFWKAKAGRQLKNYLFCHLPLLSYSMEKITKTILFFFFFPLFQAISDKASCIC